jgi:hypothetical protein
MRLPRPLLLWLDQQARQEHTSRSQILQRLILDAMRKA